MTFYTLYFSGLAFVVLGYWLEVSTRYTRGVGSWAEDRTRIALSGASYLLALQCFGLATALFILD